MFSYRLRTAIQPGVKSALFNQKAVYSAAPVAQGAQFLHTPTTTATNCEEVFATPLSSAKSSITTINPKYYGSDHKVEKKLFSPAVNSASFRQATTLQKRNYATALPEDIQRLVANAPKHSVNTDETVNHYYHQLGKEEQWKQRNFIYFMLASSRFFYATGIRLLVLKFLYSWTASADVLAVAKIEVDISSIPVGKTVTITWRGKPVFIRHRTPEEIEDAQSTPMSELKDPQPDSARVKDPNWLVLLAICTHLGCVPVSDAGAFNAFFCPCHGSHYDVSGRIRRGPAPLNLEVPPHQLLPDGKTIVLG